MPSSEVSLVAALAGGAAFGAALALAGVVCVRSSESSSAVAAAKSLSLTGNDKSSVARPETAAASSSSGRPSTACAPELWQQEQQQQEEDDAEEEPQRRPDVAADDPRRHLKQQHLKQPSARSLPPDDEPQQQYTPTRRRPDGAGARDQCAGAFATCIDLVSPVDMRKRPDPFDSRPRTAYLNWDDYFMSVAFLSSQRSKDPNKQVRVMTMMSSTCMLHVHVYAHVHVHVECGSAVPPPPHLTLKASRWSPPHHATPTTNAPHNPHHHIANTTTTNTHAQVGAVIVSQDNIILSIGYNGFPRGCPDDQLPWAKKSRSGNVLDTKYPYVVHAEANALLNKNQASVAGAVRRVVGASLAGCKGRARCWGGGDVFDNPSLRRANPRLASEARPPLHPPCNHPLVPAARLRDDVPLQ